MSTETQDDTWSRFQARLRAVAPPTAWQAWLQHLGYAGLEDHTLVLEAPSELHARWVQDKHGRTLADAVASVLGPDHGVRFVIGEGSESPSGDGLDPATIDLRPQEGTSDLDGVGGTGAGDRGPGGRGPGADASPSRDTDAGFATASRDGSRLSPKYTFDKFVVGQSNRFAHAAAMAVAEQPGTDYNPLFIYGGAGLGKTHLLHAVGHHVRELRPGARVRYVTSEAFFSEFIDGIRRKRMDAFKSRYRETDVLLLDDVQFFEGKEQILEEFFHTFNTLYESGRQIVLSSDRHPRDLQTLEDRLRSRFEWGLLTDIQPPDIETRLAILRKNAENATTPIPAEVLEFIAFHVENNIRELEGALTRVAAYASLTGSVVDLDNAKVVLQDLVKNVEQRPVTADDILVGVCSTFGLSPQEITGPSRKQPIVRARQIAMYLCRELTDLSLPRIGRVFGRDHTTVLHSVEKVKKLMRTEPDVLRHVTDLVQDLKKGAYTRV